MSFPDVTVTGDAVASDRQVSIAVKVVEEFTERTPARLRIRFTNEATTPRELLFGGVPPFGPLVSDSNSDSDGSGVLHVIPDDDAVPAAGLYEDAVPRRSVDGCWQLANRYDVVDRGIRWPADPGATTATDYVVLNDPGADECLPPGEYRFGGEWGERSADGEAWFQWGFTLALEIR